MIPAALAFGAGSLPGASFAVLAAQGHPPLPQLRLAPLFTDGAVLQRDRPLAIWGRARPRDRIEIRFSGELQRARADRSGRWRAVLRARAAGPAGTLEIATAGGEKLTLKDVTFGDVWLCSGQSNMAFRVEDSLNGRGVVARSTDPDLRFFRVEPQSHPLPQESLATAAAWAKASPATTAAFAAPCYFMGAQMRRDKRVPIGLIAAAWGGTGLNTWRSDASLQELGDASESRSLLRQFAENPSAGLRAWAAVWESWWRSRSADAEDREPWRMRSGDWRPVPSLAPWETWPSAGLETFDGTMWYHGEIVLSAEEAGAVSTLDLGLIDDVDVSWLNGTIIGSIAVADVPRSYPIEPGLAKQGRNLIAVSVRDLGDRGGILGPEPALLLRDGRRLPLRAWSFRPVPPEFGRGPRTPWDPRAGVSVAYNGMIAPLGPYGLKGVAWYQGEAETRPELTRNYSRKLASMIADWRRQFEAPLLPFLVVQLPNHRAYRAEPGPSAWAEIRNHQRLAVAGDKAAALVPTLGLGSETDVHPSEKQEVGRRLARAADNVAYGMPDAPKGVVPFEASLDAGTVTVSFDNVVGQLVSFGGQHVLSFEVCADAQPGCRFADARITGPSTVAIEADGPADKVRFGWSDNPMINLADATGMLIGSFEITVASK